MGKSPDLLTFFFLLLLFSSILLRISQATIFEITNQCSYTVWAATNTGGGKQLKPDETWVYNMVVNDTNRAVVIWGRTNCTFDAHGNGSCETGNCNKRLGCQEDVGVSPTTFVEFLVDMNGHLDTYDMSLVLGFNIPMKIIPSDGNCREVSCSADIKGECPVELRAPGGCNHPCQVFKTELYCCETSRHCIATYLSDFFKTKCPEAYSHAGDYEATTRSCPTGSNYRVLFCPSVASPSPLSPPPYDSSLAHMCISIVNVKY